MSIPRFFFFKNKELASVIEADLYDCQKERGFHHAKEII